jgi:hypothetical protein
MIYNYRMTNNKLYKVVMDFHISDISNNNNINNSACLGKSQDPLIFC